MAQEAAEAAKPWLVEPCLEMLIQPHVQLPTPNSAVVSWKTMGYVNPTIRYGTDPAKLDQTVPASAIKVCDDSALSWTFPLGAFPTRTLLRDLATTPASEETSRAVLSGLKPNTTYYYALYDGDRLLAGGGSLRFKTAPEAGADAPLRLWAVGNATTGGLAQAQVHRAMRDFVENDKRPPELMLYLGEVPARASEYVFFRPYADTLRGTPCWAAGAASLFVLPTQGEAGGAPSLTEEYYSFRRGRVHFVCLSSIAGNVAADSKMLAWLKEDLARIRAEGKADWLVAFLGRPPYSKGTVDSDADAVSAAVRRNVMPALEAGGADLVLCGTSAVYERSMLINGAYDKATDECILDRGDGDPKGAGPYRKARGLKPNGGTVVVVAGNGGAPLAQKPGRHPLMQKTLAEHGSLIVDISGDALTAMMLDKSGAVGDRFSILKRDK